jgi:hypothetical protein
MHAALATYGVDGSKVIQADLEYNEDDDCKETLSRFVTQTENEAGKELMPFAWNPKKNGDVGFKRLGLNNQLRWPACLEEYAEKYIGLHGHLLPQAKREQANLQPFVTVETVRVENSVPVSDGLYVRDGSHECNCFLNSLLGKFCVCWTAEHLAATCFHGQHELLVSAMHSEHHPTISAFFMHQQVCGKLLEGRNEVCPGAVQLLGLLLQPSCPEEDNSTARLVTDVNILH